MYAITLLYTHRHRAHGSEVMLSRDRALPNRDKFRSWRQPLRTVLGMPTARNAVNGATENIEAVTKLLQSGRKLLRAAREFGTEAVATVDQALTLLEAHHKEEIKLSYHVKTSLHDLVLITEKAFLFLDKVTDIFWYGKNDDVLEDATKGMRASPPNLEPLRGLMSQLKRSLKQAIESYSAFEVASKTAMCSFTEAAKTCAVKARESRDRKMTTKVAGGTASGLAIGTGVVAVGGAGAIATVGTIASIVIGIPTLGIGTLVGLVATAAGTAVFGTVAATAGVAGGVATHFIAKDFKETESSFRAIREHFNSLLSCAHKVHEVVAETETKQEEASTQVDHISYCMDDSKSTVLLQTALSHLHEVCSDSHGTATAITAQLKDRLQDLKVKLNDD